MPFASSVLCLHAWHEILLYPSSFSSCDSASHWAKPFLSNTLQQNKITLSALRQRHGHFIFMYICKYTTHSNNVFKRKIYNSIMNIVIKRYFKTNEHRLAITIKYENVNFLCRKCIQLALNASLRNKSFLLYIPGSKGLSQTQIVSTNIPGSKTLNRNQLFLRNSRLKSHYQNNAFPNCQN